MSRPFASKYDNPKACVTCRGDIKIGQMVRYVQQGSKDLAHDVCPSSAPSPSPAVDRPGPIPPPPYAGAGREESRGSWTLEFTSGPVLVRRAFLRNERPTTGEVEEFRAFTREVAP